MLAWQGRGLDLVVHVWYATVERFRYNTSIVDGDVGENESFSRGIHKIQDDEGLREGGVFAV